MTNIILLLEPDIILGKIYSSALTARGNRVLWARTIAEGMELLEENAVDIIVMEIQIALHNGLEFLYEVRSYNDWQKIAVIIHSVVSEERLGITSDIKKQLGVVDYLHKSNVTLHELARAVDRTLQKSAHETARN